MMNSKKCCKKNIFSIYNFEIPRKNIQKKTKNFIVKKEISKYDEKKQINEQFTTLQNSIVKKNPKIEEIFPKNPLISLLNTYDLEISDNKNQKLYEFNSLLNKNKKFSSKNKKEKNLDINYLRKIIGLEKKTINKQENLKKKTQNQALYERGYLKSKRKKRFKLKFFFDLCFILTKIFTGESPKIKSFNLTRFKEEILFLILLRKYKKYFSPKHLKFFQKLKNFREKLNQIIYLITKQEFQKSFKREEENMKFIFNTTLKRMKIKFYQKNNFSFNEENEKKFYNKYFNFSKKNNLIGNLFSEKKIHNFNKKDLVVYFMTKHFKEEFEFYLDQFFKIIYLKEIYKKWENFFKIYEKKYCDYEICIEKILEKMRNSKRFKFPWNINEVDSAIFSFHKILDKI